MILQLPFLGGHLFARFHTKHWVMKDHAALPERTGGLDLSGMQWFRVSLDRPQYRSKHQTRPTPRKYSTVPESRCRRSSARPQPRSLYSRSTLSTQTEVPPKSPVVERNGSPGPLVLNLKSSKTQLLTPASMHSGGFTPISASDSRRSPNGIYPLPTPPTTFTNPFSASPASSRGSPRIERRDPVVAHVMSSHNRNMSESSIMERGRPALREIKRSKTRAMSESTGGSPAPDNWQLPQGMRVPEASRRMSDVDKKLLHKQACDQAGNFEVLNKRDVASMSRVRILI
jgi:hypothetical protein